MHLLKFSANYRSAAAVLIAVLSARCAPAIPAPDMSQAMAGQTFNRVGDYVISANDQVNVKVYGQEALTGTYVVAASGIMTVPIIGFVQASGLTSLQLTDKLQRALKPFVKNPLVTVSVAGKDSYQVYFSGELTKPGGVVLQTRTTLLQGIALAGGLTRYATGRIVLLRQDANGAVRRFATTYFRILSGGDGLDRLVLERGDIVHAE
jgi:polysaccharide biosynthesis/export protein